MSEFVNQVIQKNYNSKGGIDSFLHSRINSFKTFTPSLLQSLDTSECQSADIYAHVSPVGLVSDIDLLKDGSFDDALGSLNVFERIMKLGAKKFYRVDYGEEESKLTEKQKRTIEKEFVYNGLNRLKLIDTSIADNDYIIHAIEAYVGGDMKAKENLYTEPSNDEIALEEIQKELGLDQDDLSKKMQQYHQQHLDKIQDRQDNTLLDQVTIYPKKK